MKKLSLLLTMFTKNTFLVNASPELWDMLNLGDNFVIKNNIAKDALFAFQVDQISETTLKQIVGKYFRVSKKQLDITEQYQMYIEMTQYSDPRGKK